MAVRLSNAKATATGSTTSRKLGDRFADVVNVKDFGAKGDGATDDTTAMRAALTAAQASGASIFVPPGLYVTDTLQAKSGMRILGANLWGSNPVYAQEGQGMAALKAKVGGSGHVIEITTGNVGGHHTNIEIGHLAIFGEGDVTGNALVGSGHGIYVHDNGNPPASHIYLHDLNVGAMGGKGIFMPEQWHTTIERVSVTKCGDNAFELLGGNSTLLTRCYAQVVAAGKVGFRIYGGRVPLIACNGIDSGSGAGAIWGQFGQYIPAGDPSTREFTGTLIGSNVEEAPIGIDLKYGSTVKLISTVFTGNATADMIAIRAAWPRGGLTLDDSNYFTIGGTASWAHGQPIESPFGTVMAIGDVQGWKSGSGAPYKYWDPGSEQLTAANGYIQQGGGGLRFFGPVNFVGSYHFGSIETTISQVLARSVREFTWDPPSVAADAFTYTTVSHPDADPGDEVEVSFSLALPAGAMLSANAGAEGSVHVHLLNKTGAPLDLGSGTLRVVVWKHN